MRHFAKLCLDAEVGAGVRLKLGISCHGKESDKSERYLSHSIHTCPKAEFLLVTNHFFEANHVTSNGTVEPPIWLYVQSMSIQATASHIGVPRDGRQLYISKEQSSYCQGCVSDSKKMSFPQDLEDCRPAKPKRRRLGFLTTNVEGEEIEYLKDAQCTLTACSTEETNLRQTNNFCHYLKQKPHQHRTTFTKHCIGYLETPNFFKHKFWLDKGQNVARNRSQDVACNAIFSIPDLMAQSADETLTVVDQLKLAHKTAVAILQFNTTPWLTQKWRLHDLCYFGTHSKFSEEVVRSLHLSSQISDYRQKPQVMPMEGLETNATHFYTFSEEEYLGINNPTLFSLGVALLELGHWKPLESLSREQDPNLTMTARRLAACQTPLGPKYQKIARKCLQCTFRSGTDLSKEELQSEIYDDVVCQLERMIESLSI